MIEGFYVSDLTIMLPKIHYTQYPDSENVLLFWYMLPSTHQPGGAQLGLSGPSDNWFKWYKGSMAVGTDSFPFQKCIIHNIQTRKIWYYFYTCLRVPFNGWEHSRGHRTIDINDRRVLCVGPDDYASENPLYTISRLGKCAIILIHASEYPSTGGSTTGAVGAVRQLI